jgi:hypothetical protein
MEGAPKCVKWAPKVNFLSKIWGIQEKAGKKKEDLRFFSKNLHPHPFKKFSVVQKKGVKNGRLAKNFF